MQYDLVVSIQVDVDVVTAVTVFEYPDGPGLHVCPPVQENFDSLEVAFLGSIVQCGGLVLLET